MTQEQLSIIPVGLMMNYKSINYNQYSSLSNDMLTVWKADTASNMVVSTRHIQPIHYLKVLYRSSCLIRSAPVFPEDNS